jgi:hypothetical protein
MKRRKLMAASIHFIFGSGIFSAKIVPTIGKNSANINEVVDTEPGSLVVKR